MHTQLTKAGSGETRHDSAPLVKRFPQLADLVSATWMSGTLGDGRIPGPSTSWIDAVIELTPADYDALATQATTASTTAVPGLSPSLVKDVPEGRRLESAELNAQLSPEGFSSTAFLIENTHTLVLLSVFS